MNYHTSGPIDCTSPMENCNVEGKTAIVTGGALGIGEAYVRALVAAGAFVVIADLNEEAGNKLNHKLPKSTAFVRCDVTSWQSQLSVFKKARNVSPTNRIDIVIANAGISTNDQILPDDINNDEPTGPNLQITNVNVVGVLLTTKLALWYFRKQNTTQPNRDQCLVLQGSVTGYVDIYGAPQYTLSKFALRGLMRSLRQSEQAYGIRVNLITPWYVKTTIITDALGEAVEQSGAGFATLDDAGQTLMRIVCDDSVHGKATEVLKRQICEHTMLTFAQGRAIAVVPREWHGAHNGYIDMDQDDFREEIQPWMHKMQEDVLKPVRWIQSQGLTKNVY